ncbi:NUDIX domain-containing protein [Herbidospora daliensis]|uniref:NUDIX domain-containing protein n=1 Tax=Herbidospora daliensis TaxID=295585 RepID=UPI000A566A4F|nr:NUDIX domain-containing protein [Herbidospora daliensis]
MADRQPDLLRTAGALIWRGDPKNPLVAVINRTKKNDWCLPKGKLDPGEHLIAAGFREAVEETGLKMTFGRWLTTVKYRKKGWKRRTDYWAAHSPEGDFVQNSEVNRLHWKTLDEAERLLTESRDAPVVRAFEARTAVTKVLIMAVHGTLEGGDDGWQGKGRIRPLDARGLWQADRLHGVLNAYRPSYVVAGQSERCRQTLGPYATEQGLGIRNEKLLTKKDFEPNCALRMIHTTMEAGECAVVCGYRQPVEDTLKLLLAARNVDDEKIELFPGAFVVVHYTEKKIISLERYLN